MRESSISYLVGNIWKTYGKHKENKGKVRKTLASGEFGNPNDSFGNPKQHKNYWKQSKNKPGKENPMDIQWGIQGKLWEP